MSELIDPVFSAYENFIAPFLTFGAIGLWLSINVVMQGVKALQRTYVPEKFKKVFNTSKHAAPYALGILGAVALPIFPDQPMHEVVLAGFLCGFIADKAHLLSSKLLGAAKKRGGDSMSDERKALLEKVEKILT